MDTSRQVNSEVGVDLQVRKPLRISAEFQGDQSEFFNAQGLNQGFEVNGSVSGPDSHPAVNEYHENGFAEINRGHYQDQNAGGEYQYNDNRDDNAPLLDDTDDQELPLEEDQDDEGHGHSPDGVHEPPRKVHVEGTNVNSSHEGEIDSEGYRIDQHQETEHFSHTREVREFDDHLKIVQEDNRTLKLEEVKTKETVRQATMEEMKALLGAAVFDDKDEIELGTEIIVEGFTRVEQTHEETDAGGLTSRNVTVTETREREEVHEDPNKPQLPSLEGNAPSAEEHKSQCHQVSGDNGNLPALTGVSVDSEKKNLETESSRKVPETSSASELVDTPKKDIDNKNDTLTNDDTPSEKSKDNKGKKSSPGGKSDGKKGSKSPSGSSNDVLRDEKKGEKVHRGGFFCKQKHSMSKGHSPASTLERDSSLTGDESKSKGWSLFGRKSGKRKDTPEKKNGLDTSKSDHSTLGDSNEKDKRKSDSLDRSMNNSVKLQISSPAEEKLTSGISTSSNMESLPPAKPYSSRRASVNSITSTAISAGYYAVVAIDLGATVSSYAYCFTHDNPEVIYGMRKPEGSDPGLCDPKYPTALLLTPDGEFHSFGFTARNVYQALDPEEAAKWMYFDTFRKQLTTVLDSADEPIVRTTNGRAAPAAALLEYALRFLSYEAMQDLSARMGAEPVGKVRWVITAPAGWHAEARHWIRQVACKVGLASAELPQQLLVMQEPQAAAVAVHQLQTATWITECEQQRQQEIEKEKQDDKNKETDQLHHPVGDGAIEPKTRSWSMLVSCGGDEVFVSVYDVTLNCMTLHYQSLTINCGGTGVNDAFVGQLNEMFGAEFIEDYRTKKPSGWADLIQSFESYKRSLDPVKANPLNVPLPFSFIDHHQKHFGFDVELSIEKYGRGRDIVWTQQGMLRFLPPAWSRLFRPVFDKILDAIRKGINNPAFQNMEYLWLIGGFSECASLQHEIRNSFRQLKVIVPRGTSHVAAKGATMFGVDPVQIKFLEASDIAIPSRAR